MSINKRIISLREKKNWSQKELARRININQSVMNRIESGERPVKDEELSKLAIALECSADYLLGIESNSPKPEDKEFEAFANDPSLQKWYKELPESKEEDLRRLRKMWEILKDSGKI
ncbi:hypothetical protein KZO01_06040 [Kurthia zopfii]|uniref:HTH-type transcriptional regulator immR n=1 Tax=Kurthia zopfii TaxID=1650 RepID=A0A8B4Q908_9BACL|nr:helix-turn-helix transcriptional regulator [Kurthia zopfii]PWI23526.1 XRE family transcriptional regulator [Kurthia zopfii]TDR35554.1 helix-turn-helix protein [Kurthia zopfii]GEK30295.1 hypothetical protein KZO01_06040 [Kurthia zopfii]STX09184.1 HTH-type transcriptional regulator immR [Kurthia zopfii]